MEEFLCGLVLGAMIVPMWNVICKLFRRRSIIDEPLEEPVSVVGAQYVDWNKVSEGYDWACLGDPEHFMGEGYLRIYKFKPEIKMYSMFEDWGCIDEDAVRDPSVLDGPLPPWRESLRQRPKE